MKKILSLILALNMLFAMALSCAAAYDFRLSQSFVNEDAYSMGDINDDGALNAVDSYNLKMAIVGMGGDGIIGDAGDFDADGKITASDSYSLKLCLNGTRKPESFENGKQLFSFTVAGNDISEYGIVLNEGITDENNSYFAALNLKKYINQVVGVDIPMSIGTKETERAIYINEMSTKTERGAELGIEGFKYEVKDGEIYIEGTYRGTMYAVFEIVEEYLGVRFIANNESFVYEQRSVDIPEGTVVEYQPKLVFRHSCQTYGSDGALSHYFPHKLNGTQLYAYDAARYGTLSGPIYSNAHSFYEYWKMASGTYPADTTGMTEQQILEAKFASGTFPDAYGWQPCATDDTAYDKLFQGMLDCNKMSMCWGNVLHYEEEISVISFSILDNQHYCTCRNCTKISRVEGFSGLYLQLYNRAVVDIQEYYPGIRLYGIVYAKDFPKTIKPHDNLVILYCGVSCHNHILGMEECYEKGGQLNGMKNDNDIEALSFWGSLCAETGAELWFWIYPVNYHYYLVDCPNIPNLYYNTKYLIDECNVNGIYYEGGGQSYIFEALKAYVTSQLLWDPDMSYEEYCDIIREYIYINYGEGVDEIFKYIEMQTAAGDECGTCFTNNYDRPGDMFSYEYLAENYEEMRALLEGAYEKTVSDAQREKITKLMVTCDFMALSSLHTEMYVNGSEESRQEFAERYEWMYNKLKEYNMRIFSSDIYNIPDKCDPTENPMIQFYEDGSRRPGVRP